MTASFANKYGLRFHHLGLAVRSPETASAFLKGLGYTIGEAFFDPLQNVNLVMCKHGNMPYVELIWPAPGQNPLDRLIDKHRDGLVYHMCYSTDNLDASLDALESDEDMRLHCVSEPKKAILFGGKEVSFYVIADVGLIEIIDNAS